MSLALQGMLALIVLMHLFISRIHYYHMPTSSLDAGNKLLKIERLWDGPLPLVLG